MDHPYLTHFRLSEAPFNITPDPAFLYLSASHREALAQLSYGINARKGFVVLTGEVGTGKTTLIHSLLGDLNQSTHTAFIFSAVVTLLDLLRYVCEEFALVDLKRPQTSVHDCMVLLNEFLLEKYRNRDNCAVIIDEAQNLSAEVLEGVRLLSNFETSKDKLLQIVLVGQPELAARLNSQELRQLKQRVTLRYHLRGLTSSECRDYITNRLQVAGGDPAIFTADALEAIHVYSGGIPRLINVLCDNGLLTAYAVGKRHVDAAMVAEVAEDLSISTKAPFAIAEHAKGASWVRVASADLGRKSVTEGERTPPQSAPRLAIVNDLSTASRVNGNLSANFIDALGKVLTEAMGPMSGIVLREEVRRLAPSVETFPKEKWEALVESVSREVLDPIMKQRFQKIAFDLMSKAPR